MDSSREIVNLELAVQVGSEPIAGALRAGTETWRPFVGWVALVRSIEDVAGVTATSEEEGR
jgi:hypothetical protein